MTTNTLALGITSYKAYIKVQIKFAIYVKVDINVPALGLQFEGGSYGIAVGITGGRFSGELSTYDVEALVNGTTKFHVMGGTAGAGGARVEFQNSDGDALGSATGWLVGAGFTFSWGEGTFSQDTTGGVINIATMKDDSILGVGYQGKLYQRFVLNAPWTTVSNPQGGFTSIAVMLDGTILGVGSQGKLYAQKYLTAPWTKAPDEGGSVSDIAIMLDGTILGIGSNGQLFTRKNLDYPWAPTPNPGGGVSSITVMLDGTILGVGYQGKLYTRKNLAAPWVKAPDQGGGINSITIMQDGTILGINASHQLYTRKSLESPWVVVSDK